MVPSDLERRLEQELAEEDARIRRLRLRRDAESEELSGRRGDGTGDSIAETNEQLSEYFSSVQQQIDNIERVNAAYGEGVDAVEKVTLAIAREGAVREAVAEINERYRDSLSPEQLEEAAARAAAMAGSLFDLEQRTEDLVEAEQERQAQIERSRAAEEASIERTNALRLARRQAEQDSRDSLAQLREQASQASAYLRAVERGPEAVAAFERHQAGLNAAFSIGAAATQEMRVEAYNLGVEMYETEKATRAATDAANDNTDAEKDRKRAYEEGIHNVTTFATAAGQLANALGLVDDSGQRAANSLLQVGAGVAEIAGGNYLRGIAGLIGGISGLLSGRNREAEERERERQRVLESNTNALKRLADELSGTEFSVAELENFLALGQGVISTGTFNAGGRPDEPITATGLTGPIPLSLRLIAKEFGIELDNSVASLQALNQAIELQIEIQKRREEQFNEDLEVRRLVALGREQEAEDLRRSTANQRELDEARRQGYGEETIARLRVVQGLEAEAAARDRLLSEQDQLRGLNNQESVNELIAGGASDAEVQREQERQRIIDNDRRQRQQVSDAVDAGLITRERGEELFDVISRATNRLLEDLAKTLEESERLFNEDLEVRRLVAVGRDQEAEDLRRSLANQRELDEARRQGYGEETIARIENIQAIEAEAAAREAAQRRLDETRGFNLDLARLRLEDSGAGEEELRVFDNARRIEQERQVAERRAQEQREAGIISQAEYEEYVRLINRRATNQLAKLGDSAEDAADVFDRLSTDVPRIFNVAAFENLLGSGTVDPGLEPSDDDDGPIDVAGIVDTVTGIFADNFDITVVENNTAEMATGIDKLGGLLAEQLTAIAPIDDNTAEMVLSMAELNDKTTETIASVVEVGVGISELRRQNLEGFTDLLKAIRLGNSYRAESTRQTDDLAMLFNDVDRAVTPRSLIREHLPTDELTGSTFFPAQVSASQPSEQTVTFTGDITIEAGDRDGEELLDEMMRAADRRRSRGGSVLLDTETI